MLRRDSTASFQKSGGGIFSRYRFVSGSARASRRLNRAAFDALMRRQQDAPVLVLQDAGRDRTCWMFRDGFYWDEDGLSEVEVRALLMERLTQQSRRVKRAVALMEQMQGLTELPDVSGAARAPIPDDVKLFVWQRDRGCCVRCGSQERLEFDHVIPLALGGANTARNLQLLCETCNRTKGASLV